MTSTSPANRRSILCGAVRRRRRHARDVVLDRRSDRAAGRVHRQLFERLHRSRSQGPIDRRAAFALPELPKPNPRVRQHPAAELRMARRALPFLWLEDFAALDGDGARKTGPVVNE